MDKLLDWEQKTDAELVKISLVDQDNFLYIVDRYKDKLFNYICRISNIDTEEAEDLLQNVFIKTYLNLNEFDQGLKFSSWIYRITHNEVIDNYRKLKSRPQLVELDLNDQRLRTLISETDIFQKIDNRMARQKIVKIINQLDFKLKEVLWLKFFEDKDYHEISDIIKKPLGTVASRINRAKREIKKELIKNKIYD